MATTDVFADLRERFAAAGQSHVFQWYDEGLLSEDQAASLYKELAPLDLPRINKLFEVGDGDSLGKMRADGKKRLAGAFCHGARVRLPARNPFLWPASLCGPHHTLRPRTGVVSSCRRKARGVTLRGKPAPTTWLHWLVILSQTAAISLPIPHLHAPTFDTSFIYEHAPRDHCVDVAFCRLSKVGSPPPSPPPSSFCAGDDEGQGGGHQGRGHDPRHPLREPGQGGCG